MSVVIVGAGVIGLSTACLLRERLDPKINVTVIADTFDTETTSYGAAGSFRVQNCLENDPIRCRRWCNESFSHYYELARSKEAVEAGALIFSMNELFREEYPADPFYMKTCFDATRLSCDTISKLGLPKDCKSGIRYTSVMLESRYYLPFLRTKFEAMGGQVEHRRLKSLSVLAAEYDLAVNCTGLGARDLCNDPDVYPVRGQTLRVKAPWIKDGWYLDQPVTYIYPGRDHIILGGFRDDGVYDKSISDAQTTEILRRTERLAPQLKGAVIEEIWVGLRPGRKKVRLETDLNSFSLPVVHNYGHGGHGISLARGTSVEAAEKVETVMKYLKPKL